MTEQRLARAPQKARVARRTSRLRPVLVFLFDNRPSASTTARQTSRHSAPSSDAGRHAPPPCLDKAGHQSQPHAAAQVLRGRDNFSASAVGSTRSRRLIPFDAQRSPIAAGPSTRTRTGCEAHQEHARAVLVRGRSPLQPFYSSGAVLTRLGQAGSDETNGDTRGTADFACAGRGRAKLSS